MLENEEELTKAGYMCIAGVDEVGRGALAGPVFAAAVILPKDYFSPLIKDSKKLSKLQREKAYREIEDVAISIGIGEISAEKIDQINIYQATKEAMAKAVCALKKPADYLLIDAMRLEKIHLPQRGIISGDSKSISIAAASIIAKVTRDKLMVELSSTYPNYGFENHKGYGTEKHRKAIKEFGATRIHRKSYKGVC